MNRGCVLLCLCAIMMTSVAAKKFYTDCTNVMGGCVTCPKGTYRAYEDCTKHKLPEPTCYIPYPQPIENMACSYPHLCYCSPPTVRDQESNLCVLINQCGLS